MTELVLRKAMPICLKINQSARWGYRQGVRFNGPRVSSEPSKWFLNEQQAALESSAAQGMW